MKKIVTADIHLTSYKDDPINDDYSLPRRLASIIRSMVYICDYAMEHNIKDIYIAGDLYNDKDIISTEAQNAFIDYVIKEYPHLNFIILSGNHDLSSTGENGTSCINALNQFENVECITNEVKVYGNISCVPFSKYNLKENIIDSQNDILISHFGLNEAVLQSGLSLKSEMSAKDLSSIGYKLVILGHYHKPQHLKSSTINIWYTGNLTSNSWNDKNEEKRFLIFDDETLEVESVSLDGYSEKYVELIITNDSNKKEIFEKARQEKEKGNFVRIRNKSDETIESNEDTEDLIVLEDKEIEVIERGINITMSEEDRLKGYLTYKDISEENHEKYVNVALKIINEVKNKR